MHSVRFAILITSICVLLTACASQPKPLQGDFSDIDPRAATEGDYTGTRVRWGGQIIQVEPKEDSTCFVMLSAKLDVYGRPYWRDQTGGRFIACRNGFYDPAIFKAGSEVTFTGTIEAYEERKIGQYDYRFSRIAADTVYLWPKVERVNVLTAPPAPWPWWGWW